MKNGTKGVFPSTRAYSVKAALLKNPPDDSQVVGIPLAGGVENAMVVQRVYADLPMGMNDLVIFQYQAYVNDAAFGIIEKGQVAGLRLCGKMHLLAMGNLLPGIPRQLVATNAINLLGETRAVDAEYRAAAPNIGRFNIRLGNLCEKTRPKTNIGIGGPSVINEFLIPQADIQSVEKRQGAADEYGNAGMGITDGLYNIDAFGVVLGFPILEVSSRNRRMLFEIYPAFVIVSCVAHLQPVALGCQQPIALAKKKLCHQFTFIRRFGPDRHMA